MAIPKSVIRIVKNEIGNLNFIDDESRVTELRENAITAIRRYKEVRQRFKEAERYKAEMKGWLKSIGEEVNG
jgi:hypothetical protein